MSAASTRGLAWGGHFTLRATVSARTGFLEDEGFTEIMMTGSGVAAWAAENAGPNRTYQLWVEHTDGKERGLIHLSGGPDPTESQGGSASSISVES